MISSHNKNVLVQKKKLKQEEDQWIQMFNKQVKMNQQMQDCEQKVNKFKKEQFKNNLQEQCQINFLNKSYEVKQDKKEQFEEMQYKIQEHKNIQIQDQQKKHSNQNMLVKDYDNMTNQNNQQKNLERQQKLNYENNMYQQNQQKLKEIQAQKMQTREQNIQRADEYNMITNDKMRQRREDIDLNNKEQQNLMQDKVLREQLKEMKYKQFFDDQGQNHLNKQKLFTQRVKTEADLKEKQYERFISKNMKEENENFSKYLNGVEQKRKEMKDQIYKHQQDVQTHKSQQKERNNELRKQSLVNRIAQQNVMTQQDEEYKQEVNNQRLIYSQVLSSQMKERQEKENKECFEMKKIEKCLNRVAVVPGFQPQLGGVPQKNLQQIMLTDTSESSLKMSLPYLQQTNYKERVSEKKEMMLRSNRSDLKSHKEKFSKEKNGYHRKGDQYRDSSMAGIF